MWFGRNDSRRFFDEVYPLGKGFLLKTILVWEKKVYIIVDYTRLAVFWREELILITA
jgi:hypothetical protein